MGITLGVIPRRSGSLAADNDKDVEADSTRLLPATPDWVSDLDAAGRFVQVFGSESKFREDYNVQNGAALGGGVHKEWDGGKIIFFDGQFQPVDNQDTPASTTAS